jgi:hypothetical protein
MRRYPRINGPAALPLFRLAPHGVFPAPRIASRAVSSYLAFSPLPALRCQRTGGAFSVTLSVTALLQTRRPRVLRGMLPYGVRTFLWRTLLPASDHLPSREVYDSAMKFAIRLGRGTLRTRRFRWSYRRKFKKAPARRPETSSPSPDRSSICRSCRRGCPAMSPSPRARR